MYRLIYINEEISGYEYHEEGTLTEEDAYNLVRYKEKVPSQQILDAEIAEQKLGQLRAVRNKFLRGTDHWAFQDTPEMTQAQIAYRQALRDITEHYTSLDDVVWPEMP